MINFEYVFSGASYLRPNLTGKHRTDLESMEKYSFIMKDGIRKITQDIERGYGDHITPSISLMYNAYTEGQVGQVVCERDNLGFKNLWSDSGGLQVVTQGKELTEEMKVNSYRWQQYSDFAMCFDEIPCENLVEVDKKASKSKMYNWKDKIYRTAKAGLCATQTALNIRKQIEILTAINPDTQVFYILQGNEQDDFIKWFEVGEKMLDGWHWDHIAGIAPSSVCLGNGEIESVELIMAYYKLTQNFEINKIKNRLHLLGIGSIARLLSLIYLLHLFENRGITISIDSTRESSSYVMRNFNLEGVDPSTYIKEVLSYFAPILSTHLKNLDLDHIFNAVYDDYLIRQTLTDKFKNSPNSDFEIACYAITTLCIVYKMHSFFNLLSGVIKADDNTPLSFLREVNNLDDFQRWKKEFAHRLKSKRILRDQGTAVDIERFFI